MNPNFFLVYVDSPSQSAQFYRDLLEQEPVEESPTFALFRLKSGAMLGFWSKHTVEPTSQPRFGGFEIGIPLGSEDDVKKTHQNWMSKGIEIVQEPVPLDFGYTFVGLDPDGHRLRVFYPFPV